MKKCNSDQWWNNDNCRCECKKCHIMFGILLHLASVMDGSAIMSAEIIELCDEETNTVLRQ